MRFKPSPVIRPLSPTNSSNTANCISSPKCLENNEAIKLKGAGIVSSYHLNNSSSFSKLCPLILDIKEAASNSTGSTKGFSVIFYVMNSSIVKSRDPLILRRKRGAMPPRMGKMDASTSQLPTILMRRSDSLRHTFNFKSKEIPLRSWMRTGSPPSSKMDLGDAANLRDISAD